jgi:hypothetical protein
MPSRSATHPATQTNSDRTSRTATRWASASTLYPPLQWQSPAGANLHNQTDVRVLTGDFGMRLRVQQMDLKVLQLPADYRKPQPGSG